MVLGCGFADGALRWSRTDGRAADGAGSGPASDGALPGLLAPGSATAVGSTGDGTLVCFGTSCGAVRLCRPVSDAARATPWLRGRTVGAESLSGGADVGLGGSADGRPAGLAEQECHDMDEAGAEPRGGSLTSSAVRAAARAGIALGVSQARSACAEASALLSGSAGAGGLSKTGQGGGWARSCADVAPGPATGVCLAVISGFATGHQCPITAVSLSRSANGVAVGGADGRVMVGPLTDMRVHRVLGTAPP